MTGVKICSKCGECKQHNSFHKKNDSRDGLHSACRECRKAYSRQHYQANSDNIKAKVAEYEKKNREVLAAARRDRAKRYYLENKEKIDAKNKRWALLNKDRAKETARIWYLNNSEKVSQASKMWREENADRYRFVACVRERDRRENDPIYAVKRWARYTVAHALGRRGYTKKSPAFHVIGCSAVDFRQHIERQFLKGMTWENRSEWHIDHIIPLATAKTEEDVIRLNHYTNLRPLWAEDNLKKSDKQEFLI